MDATTVNFYIEHWLKVLEENMEGQLEIRGPVSAPIEKIRDEYRFQLWYFALNYQSCNLQCQAEAVQNG